VLNVELAGVLGPEEDMARLDPIEMLNEFGDGRFAGPALPHEGDILSLFDLEGKTIEDGGLSLGVPELHFVKLHTPINLHLSPHILNDETLIAHHFKHLLDGTGSIYNIGVAVGDSSGGVSEVGAIQYKRGEFTRTELHIIGQESDACIE
jgi:hypothetical protein